jgi:Pyruvate/2-oxoacid:ferredoxin oxidoreductase gamma subunit
MQNGVFRFRRPGCHHGRHHFAEAAVIYEGLNATQSQAYGAAARGGATRSDVIISEEEIIFPRSFSPTCWCA